MKQWSTQHPLLASLTTLWLLLFITLFFLIGKKLLLFYEAEACYHSTLRKLETLTKTASQENTLTLAANTDAIKTSLQKQINDFQSYQITLPPELDNTNALPSPSFFQDYLQKEVYSLEEMASQAEITLPKDFYLGLHQFQNISPDRKELTKILQQEVALSWIAKKIMEQHGLKLHQFEWHSIAENDQQRLFSSLGFLTLQFTTDEKSFQKLFNEIIQSPYFFVIKTITVENSQQSPPSRLLEQAETSSETISISQPGIKIIFGREKVCVSMKIEILDFHASEKKATICQETSLKTLKTGWHCPKGSPSLFTSRPYLIKENHLIDLLDEKLPLFPPVPNQWLIDNNLDYSDSNILSEDSDHDGFTNLEEWLGSNPFTAPGSISSNPNDPTSHPLLWTKLRCNQSDIQKENIYLEFTGYEEDNGKKTFQLQPITPTPYLNRQGKTVFNTKVRYAQIGEKLQGLPLQVLSFEQKQLLYKEVFYDVSELILLHNETGEKYTLFKKSSLHPEAIAITSSAEVHLHYTLPTPPEIISIKSGHDFSLESLPLLKGTPHSGEKVSETYKLLNINKEAIEISHEGILYKIPINCSL